MRKSSTKMDTMKTRGVAIALGILGFCCSTSLAVDCTSKTSMTDAQRVCFAKYGLQMTGESDQVHTAAQNDPEATCRNEELYKMAISCAVDVSKQCLQQLGQSTNILPDTDAIFRGITYMCSIINNMDTKCVTDKQIAMKNCARAKALTAFSGNTDLSDTNIACKSFDIAVQCAAQELDSCALQTRDIVVRLLQAYMTPPACSSSTPGTWMPLMSAGYCYSNSSIEDSQQKCIQQEGITVQRAEFNTVDGHTAKQSYMVALMTNNEDPHAVCRELPRYQRALGCAMDVERQCMPSDYRDYIPTARQMQMLLMEMCDHVDEINQQCVTSKASDLYDCGYKYGKTIRTTDTKSILCLAYKYIVMCLQQTLPSCGERTTQLYVDMAKKYLNAPACLAI